MYQAFTFDFRCLSHLRDANYCGLLEYAMGFVRTWVRNERMVENLVNAGSTSQADLNHVLSEKTYERYTFAPYLTSFFSKSSGEMCNVGEFFLTILKLRK